LARWVAYGGQRVTISRVSPSGYATARTTTSTGYFAALIRGANIVESAGWHASFAGWSTGGTVVNGPSVSSGDAVAAVTAPLRITRVYYDSPGSDRPTTNTKLNAEYLRITNAGTRTANLYRWWVTDPAGHYYVFGGNIYLSPGYSVYLHTGTGTNGGGHYYWGLGNYVWNNTGDTAYLRSDLNYTVDTCSWGAGIGYTNC
jgi:Lamin Tail Domain